MRFATDEHWSLNLMFALPLSACLKSEDPPPLGNQFNHYNCVKTSCAGGRHNMPHFARDLDLWPFNLESGVRVRCDVGYLCVSILVFLGLSALDLGPTYATNVRRQTSDRRQTDRGQTASSLNAPPRRRGIIMRHRLWANSCTHKWVTYSKPAAWPCVTD